MEQEDFHFNNVIQTPAQLEQTASENNQTTQSSEVLTEQSVYYARKLGKKASDTEYFKNRMISDDLMEYIQKAVPLAHAVPDGTNEDQSGLIYMWKRWEMT